MWRWERKWLSVHMEMNCGVESGDGCGNGRGGGKVKGEESVAVEM